MNLSHATVVGRFRSGYQRNNRPISLTEWRVTTADPGVASAIRDLLGGDAPQEWEAKGEDNLEVFTASKSVDITLDDPGALQQKMILWGRNGKPDNAGRDGGAAELNLALSVHERRQRGCDEVGAEPDIDILFRLKVAPDLGLFHFKSGSWSLASDLAQNGTEQQLADIDGRISATLSLEEVSFTAKNGPRAGQVANHSKPVLQIEAFERARR
ncbi:hypothetical protein [Diaminobutyricimonas sp. LJ205]|uniref:recombination directionality factor n=1 Tax=Diaminobutyricimonas sp. LJ205 TaxID=2683590 RepID=UPI0012F5061A|nr:hypothetical protein [Diaminobutyricimonas sp. LJ205]